jgi:hypothetical protein
MLRNANFIASARASGARAADSSRTIANRATAA